MPEEPVTTKQHPVPQQVFGVQFKLIGDLTIRQFAILAVCGFLAFVFFSLNLFIVFRILISGFFLLLGVAFAFIPIQDQPLDQYIAAFFRAVYAPTRRMWAKSTAPVEFLVMAMPKVARVTGPEISPEESRRRLETYLGAIHEKRELSPIDLAEEQYLESIRGLAQSLAVAPAPVAAPAPYTPPPALTLEEVMAPPSAAPAAPAGVEAPPPPPTAPRPKFVEATKIGERPYLASAVNFAEPVYKVQRGRVASYFAARRNIRAGRRLTPLAIAGEMVYAPVREQVIAPELPSAPTLAEPVLPPPLPIPSAPAEPIAPVPVEPVPPPPTPEEAPPPPAPAPIPEEAPAAPLPPAPEPEKPVEAPAPSPVPSPPAEEEKEAPLVVAPAPPLPKPSAAPPIAPPKAGANIITGTVFGPQSGVLDETLVVIEDEKGNVVRATKTNELGKFTSSPLPNGQYTVRIPKTAFPFATMKIELTGKETEELEIRPK